MPHNTKIFNETDIDLSTLIDIANEFLPHAESVMGFSEPVTISLISDEQNSLNPLGKTAYYDPGEMGISLFVDGRHPKDILRSLSHELVHHTQNCNGMFDNIGALGDGYAQEDEHLREMEREAYELGNMCFRDWEDEYKKKQEWQLNEQINKQLNEGALEDLFKGLRTQRGQWKNPIKGFMQASSPGAGLTKDTFGLGTGQKSQPHFTEEDPGPHWDERPVVSDPYDIGQSISRVRNVDVPGIGDEEDKSDKSFSARKERASTVKEWLTWIFMHQGEEDRKKAFFSALYEDDLDMRLKMSLYKEYSALINKHGYGEKEVEAPEAPEEVDPQLDLYSGEHVGKPGIGPQTSMFDREGEPFLSTKKRAQGGEADSDDDGIPDSVEDAPPEESLEDWAIRAAENFQTAVNTGDEGVLANWRYWISDELPPENSAALKEAITRMGLDAYLAPPRADSPLTEPTDEPADALEAPGAQTREYETPEYAESEFAQAQRKAQLAQQAQVGKQASQISNKMINNAASRAVRSLGLPKNVINKGNLHKIVKSMTTGDANLDYRQFERALMAGDTGAQTAPGRFGTPEQPGFGPALKGVPEEQQRALAQAIANELQSIGGVNFQFYDTPEEPAMAAESLSYEEETLDDLGDIVQQRRPPRRPKSAVEPLEAHESLTFDEELKIRAAVHSAMDLILERHKLQKKQEHERKHITEQEVHRFVELAGFSNKIKLNELSWDIVKPWTWDASEIPVISSAHKWGSKDWDQTDIPVVRDIARAANVLGTGAAARGMDDEEVENLIQTDYEDRKNQRLEQAEMAFESHWAQMADNARSRIGTDQNVYHGGHLNNEAIHRLGIRLLDDNGQRIEHGSDAYKDAMKKRKVFNDNNEFVGYNIKLSEIAEAAERKRSSAERLRRRRSGLSWVDAQGIEHEGTGTPMAPERFLVDELEEYEQLGYGSEGQAWMTFGGALLKPFAIAGGAKLMGGTAPYGIGKELSMLGGGLIAGREGGELALDALEVGAKGLYYGVGGLIGGDDWKEKKAAEIYADGGEQTAWSDAVFGWFPGASVRQGNRFRDEGGNWNDKLFGDEFARYSTEIEAIGPDEFQLPRDETGYESSPILGKDPVTGEQVEIDPITAKEWKAMEDEWIGDDPHNAAIAQSEYLDPRLGAAMDKPKMPEAYARQVRRGFCQSRGVDSFGAESEYSTRGEGVGVMPQSSHGMYSTIKPTGTGSRVCGFQNVASLQIQQVNALGFLDSAGGVAEGTAGHRRRFINQNMSAEDDLLGLGEYAATKSVYDQLVTGMGIDRIQSGEVKEFYRSLELDTGLQNILSNTQAGSRENATAQRLQKSLDRLLEGSQSTNWMMGHDADAEIMLSTLVERVSTSTDGRMRLQALLGYRNNELLEKVPSLIPGGDERWAVSDADVTNAMLELLTVPYVDIHEKHEDLAKFIKRTARTGAVDYGVPSEDIQNMSVNEIISNANFMVAAANDRRAGRDFRTRLASRILNDHEAPMALVSKHRTKLAEVEFILTANVMQNRASAAVRELRDSTGGASPQENHVACQVFAEDAGGSMTSIGCRQTGKRNDEGGYLWEPIPEDALLSSEIEAFAEGSIQQQYAQFLMQEGYGDSIQYEAILASGASGEPGSLTGIALGFTSEMYGGEIMRAKMTGQGREGVRSWDRAYDSDILDAAFGYTKLHQSIKDQRVSQQWAEALRNTDSEQLKRLFTATEGTQLATEPISMFEIVSKLANPTPLISDEDLTKRMERTGETVEEIYFKEQGAIRRDALEALERAGLIDQNAINSASGTFLNPETTLGSRTGKTRDYSGATGQVDFVNWFQGLSQQSPDAHASFTKSVQLLERIGNIADMKAFLRGSYELPTPAEKERRDVAPIVGPGTGTPVYQSGDAVGRRISREGQLEGHTTQEIGQSVFMSMWYSEFGANDNTREWLIRYAPEIVYRNLELIDRRMNLFPGQSPARDSQTGRVISTNDGQVMPNTPAFQMLHAMREIMQSKRPRAAGVRRQNGQLAQGSALQTLHPTQQASISYAHIAAKINARSQNPRGGGMDVATWGIPWSSSSQSGIANIGYYNPNNNTIKLWSPRQINQYGGLDIEDPQVRKDFEKVLEASVRELQSQLNLSEAPVITDYRGNQIWPQQATIPENIQHSLSHLPNGKLIKEQIAKAFADKNINISRKKLEEVVRQHILQELNNNA